MNCSDVLDKFLKEKIVEGVTSATINHYKVQLNLFISFLNNCDIKSITYETYQDYIIYLKSRFNIGSNSSKNVKLASRTIKTYASAVRTFLQFCYDYNYIDTDIAKNIKMPKFQKKVIAILNDDDIKKIINSFDVSSFSGIRNLFILCIMLDCRFKII